jgi:signal peptidase I
MTDSSTTMQPSDDKETSLLRWLLETALLVVLAFGLAFLIRTFFVEPFIVPTGSMIPTIEINNRVLAEKITFRFIREPRYGDIVVFPDPSGEHPHLIKRVIATGGQTVTMRDGVVYVDDQALQEPYTAGTPSYPLPTDIHYPFRVPDGDLWVMGDNRTDSADSRAFGAISASAVQGRAFWTYWPLSAFGTLR